MTLPAKGAPASSLPPVHRGAETRGQEPAHRAASGSSNSLPQAASSGLRPLCSPETQQRWLRGAGGTSPPAALVKPPAKRFSFLLPFLYSHPPAPSSASHIHYRKKTLCFLIVVKHTRAVLCLVAQSCPTHCDPMDCSPPGSSVHGILQARILERIAMPSSRGTSPPRD